jgi:hypothetical protein
VARFYLWVLKTRPGTLSGVSRDLIGFVAMPSNRPEVAPGGVTNEPTATAANTAKRLDP